MTTRELRLPAAEAQRALLVLAVEEGDRGGRILPLEERRRATAAARKGRGDEPKRWLGRRAETLTGRLATERPEVPRLLRLTDLGRGLMLATLLVAFVAGLATNALGPSQRVSLLAVPLLGLVLWNVAVILFGLLFRALPLAPNPLGGRPRFVALLERWAERWVDRHGRRGTRRDGGDEEDGTDELWRQALRRYLRLWLPAVRPLATARVRRLLHAGAATIVVGAVAGMYLRGLVLEYEVTWQSTFLSGPTVDRILQVVLAPAAAVLGRPVPRAAVGGSAAPWIHLWATTAALFVLLPRAVLFLAEGATAARRGRRLAIAVPETYLRRIAAAVDVRAGRVDVVPYSYHPSAQAADTLRALLHDVFGAGAEIRLRSAVDYGGALADDGGHSRVLVFSLAQTPEVEVHGEVLTAARDGLADGQALLAVVDAAVYRRRTGEAGPGATRLAERRRSWDRVAAAAGVPAVHLDLENPPADAALTALVEGAWPPEVLAAAGAGGRR